MTSMPRKPRRRLLVIAGVCLLSISATLIYHRDQLLRWYRLYQQFESLGTNKQGYPEYRHRKTGIVMVRIPEGSFVMGSTADERERVSAAIPVTTSGSSAIKKQTDALKREQPEHQVQLSSYLIAKYELSQAEWERAMQSNPSAVKAPQLPVNNVSWEDCQAFCLATGLTLPSEAQWEYACRAGTQTVFSWGDTLSTEEANFDAQFNDGFRRSGPNSRSGLASTTAYSGNGFGLHQMHGNVREWCQDLMQSAFYKQPEATHKNPLCTKKIAPRTTNRAIRGGSWKNPASQCRTALRSRRWYQASDDHLGFRPAFNLDP